MEVHATTRFARMSPQKVREVARQIQGLPAEEAIQLLRFIPRKSARLLGKTLASAIANAENNHNLSSSDLVIVSATVNQGPVIKRSMPAARGSAHPIHKSMSHIRVSWVPPPSNFRNMGQKVNPIGFRLAVRRNWESRWYATKRDFLANILEDYRIREFLKEKLRQAAVPRIFIERAGQKVRVRIWTARPGVVIGRKGDELKNLRAEIQKVAGKARIDDIILEVNEVKRPDLVAQLVAENIALQLERRISFRRAMKKAVQTTMTNGADGIRIRLGGRLGGAEIARVESARVGRVPLHTLRENIDYGFTEARTLAGKVGIKCWICSKDSEF